MAVIPDRIVVAPDDWLAEAAFGACLALLAKSVRKQASQLRGVSRFINKPESARIASEEYLLASGKKKGRKQVEEVSQPPTTDQLPLATLLATGFRKPAPSLLFTRQVRTSVAALVTGCAIASPFL